MTIKESIRNVIIEEIKKKAFRWLSSIVDVGNQEQLKTLYKTGFINDQEIEGALEGAVISESKKYYQLVKKGVFEADNLLRPEILAYALSREDILSERQKRNLHFDHGMRIEDFCKQYGNPNLLADLRKELLIPKTIPKSLTEGYYDPHPACCHP